jgi:hypothetical protein
MRPTVGGDAAPPRSRKSSCADIHIPANVPTGPTAFFMAREEDVMGSSTSRRSSDGKPSDSNHNLDSVYGVQSLEESLREAFPDKPAVEGDDGLLKRKRRKASWVSMVEDKGNHPSASEDKANHSEDGTRQSSPQDINTNHLRRSSRTATISQPLTPLQLESPFPHSAMPSTPKSGSFRSLRLSDEEESICDNTSQAITSGGEEDEEEESEGLGSLDIGGIAPELVMPSLSMPSRRPFTARGKMMGRLKVCVAGSNGETTYFELWNDRVC